MATLLKLVGASFVVIAATVASSAAARGHPGFPILACDDPRYPYANHYGRRFRPTGFCQTRRGNGAEGVDHVRWRNWGAKEATGLGYLVVYDDGVGEFPAEITARSLYVTNSFTGGNDYLSAYQSLRVHVLARRAPKTAGVMVWRGQASLTLGVQVQE